MTACWENSKSFNGNGAVVGRSSPVGGRPFCVDSRFQNPFLHARPFCTLRNPTNASAYRRLSCTLGACTANVRTLSGHNTGNGRRCVVLVIVERGQRRLREVAIGGMGGVDELMFFGACGSPAPTVFRCKTAGCLSGRNPFRRRTTRVRSTSATVRDLHEFSHRLMVPAHTVQRYQDFSRSLINGASCSSDFVSVGARRSVREGGYRWSATTPLTTFHPCFQQFLTRSAVVTAWLYEILPAIDDFRSIV